MWKYPVYAILIICVLLVAPIAINQTLLFSFLYVDYSLNTIQQPEEFPVATKSRYLKNYTSELYYSLGRYYKLPFKYSDLSSYNPNSDTAIILIHGYGRHQGDITWLRNKLQGADNSIFTVNLKPALAGIDEIAEQSIVPLINDIKTKHGLQKFILVGASMGGLVASYYKEYLDASHDVKGVITLGTPFHGTKVAAVAAGKNSRQMCPGSEFIQELMARIRQHQDNYYVVATKFDEIVFPWHAALIDVDNPKQSYIRTFVGHLGLLHDEEIAVQLNDWIVDIKKTGL